MCFLMNAKWRSTQLHSSWVRVSNDWSQVVVTCISATSSLSRKVMSSDSGDRYVQIAGLANFPWWQNLASLAKLSCYWCLISPAQGRGGELIVLGYVPSLPLACVIYCSIVFHRCVYLPFSDAFPSFQLQWRITSPCFPHIPLPCQNSSQRSQWGDNVWDTNPRGDAVFFSLSTKPQGEVRGWAAVNKTELTLGGSSILAVSQDHVRITKINLFWPKWMHLCPWRHKEATVCSEPQWRLPLEAGRDAAIEMQHQLYQ